MARYWIDNFKRIWHDNLKRIWYPHEAVVYSVTYSMLVDVQSSTPSVSIEVLSPYIEISGFNLVTPTISASEQ